MESAPTTAPRFGAGSAAPARHADRDDDDADDPATVVRIDRLIRFASDTLDLADRRADLDLRALIDDLHADLIRLQRSDDP
jgi:hypothetical protein